MSFSSSLTELGLMYMKRREPQNIETERKWDAHVDKALPLPLLDFILKIVHAGLYSIVIDAMNTYLIEKIRPVYHIPDYELYFYGGALLNVFIQWEESGKKETAAQIAQTISAGIRTHTHS